MMRAIFLAGFLLLGISAPSFVFAQGAGQGVSFKQFTNLLLNGVNTVVIPLLFAVGFLMVLWGVFKFFIWGGDSEEGRSEGRTFLLWGIVALAVMFSTWGLVRIFMSTFGL